MWANWNNNYHLTCYNYVNMNGAGDNNQYKNYAHQKQIESWHYIHYGYSKTARKATAYLLFKAGPVRIDFTNTNHFYAEKYYFLLKDIWHGFYNG